MLQNRFIYLISRELSGDASPEELQELKRLVSEDAQLKEKWNVFRKMRRQGEADKQPDVEAALKKVWQQAAGEKSPSLSLASTEKKIEPARSLRFIGIAASVIALLAVGVYYFSARQSLGGESTAAVLSQPLPKNFTEKQNTRGIRSSIVLSDGSKIWLNADSKLDYPAVFEGRTREVYLSGEAFFEVAKNPARPFIIHLDNGTVRVLGTSFNIRAYRESPVVETSVSTGRVAFIPAKKKGQKPADTTFLTHDVKAIYSIETGEIKTIATVSNDDKAWTEGTLIFKGLTFAEIATELERTFGKKVVFADEEVKSYRLTGSFQNNSEDEILYYLSLSKAFTYRVSDEEIIISKVTQK